jgi:hypothetical protein
LPDSTMPSIEPMKARKEREEPWHRVFRRHVVASVKHDEQGDGGDQHGEHPRESVHSQREIQAERRDPVDLVADGASGRRGIEDGRERDADQRDCAGESHAAAFGQLVGSAAARMLPANGRPTIKISDVSSVIICNGPLELRPHCLISPIMVDLGEVRQGFETMNLLPEQCRAARGTAELDPGAPGDCGGCVAQHDQGLRVQPPCDSPRHGSPFDSRARGGWGSADSRPGRGAGRPPDLPLR